MDGGGPNTVAQVLCRFVCCSDHEVSSRSSNGVTQTAPAPLRAVVPGGHQSSFLQPAVRSDCEDVEAARKLQPPAGVRLGLNRASSTFSSMCSLDSGGPAATSSTPIGTRLRTSERSSSSTPIGTRLRTSEKSSSTVSTSRSAAKARYLASEGHVGRGSLLSWASLDGSLHQDRGRRSLLSAASRLTGRDSLFSGASRLSDLTNQARSTALALCGPDWFESRSVRAIGRAVRSKVFQAILGMAVVAALFVPDFFVALQIPTNLPQNVILTLVMCIFLLGFLGLLFSDPTYPGGFYFWMDIVGIAAMMFVIEWMLGEDATQPIIDRSGTQRNSDVMIAKAVRLARQAARMGRIARALRLLRLLTRRRRATDNGQSMQFAQAISKRLNHVLSTRVAFLCVSLVVLLPSLSLYEEPMNDNSMASWAALLSEDALQVYSAAPNSSAREVAVSRLNAQLRALDTFYVDVVSMYGPYEVCFREALDGAFVCGRDSIAGVSETLEFAGPRRMSSAVIVVAEHAQVSFNVSLPLAMEAAANLAGLVLFVVSLVFFTSTMSRRVHSLLILPLERTLANLRHRCDEIFEYTDRIPQRRRSSRISQECQTPEKKLELGTFGNEFLLLAKVVKKLGAVGSTLSKKEPELKPEMTDDDILLLNFQQRGHQVQDKDRSTSLNAAAKTIGRKLSEIILSVPPDDLVASIDRDSFDAFEVPDALKPGLAAHCLQSSEAARQLGWLADKSMQMRAKHFVSAAAKHYLPNPFHNFSHALDVTVGIKKMIVESEAELVFTEECQFWLLVAAIAHDLGHPGVSNQFLVETDHAYALKYNDRSPLENFHSASLFQILRNPDANILTRLPQDTYNQVRKGIVTAILATDMALHHSMIKELGVLCEVNSELLSGGLQDPEVVELLKDKGNSQLLANAFLHFADISNPMKPWTLCEKLAQLCLDEFFAQGDKEKALGIPVQMLNDRDKVNKPNSQMGFIEFVILPLAETMVSLFPSLSHYTTALGENTGHWAAMWERASEHPPEEVQKFRARAQKVVDRCSLRKGG